MKPIADRFWPKVIKSDGCWTWAGSTTNGYGKLCRGGRSEGNIFAHRLSWEIHYGPIPDGLFVLHKCDNPPCVRPEHLFLGSKKDNIDDCVNKGRLRPGSARGEAHPNALLTTAQVLDIRSRFTGKRGEISSLASEFGISLGAACAIVHGRTWKHILPLRESRSLPARDISGSGFSYSQQQVNAPAADVVKV